MSELSWVEKYRPTTLADMVLDRTSKQMLQSYLDKDTICNLLLVGRAGIGKTTLAKIIPKTLDTLDLYLNCGQEGNVDTIRTKVYDFCQAMNMVDAPKVVILDEADSISLQGQSVLRNLIEEASDDTRFIMTGNFINKIISPIQSRCTPIKLKFTIEDVVKKVIEILEKEQIKFDSNSLIEFTEEVIKLKFPDIRSVINNLEHWSINGTLTNMGVSDDSETDEVSSKVIKMLSGKPKLIREYLIGNSDKFSNDYEVLGGAIFNKLMDDGGKQLIVAESLYRMSLVLDKEIEFYSMILQLTK